MIVYNVQRRWFTMKADAETYRKAEKLPPSANYMLRIDDREGMAALLNALCGAEVVEHSTQSIQVPEEVIERNRIIVIAPDCVPAFLLKDRH